MENKMIEIIIDDKNSFDEVMKNVEISKEQQIVLVLKTTNTDNTIENLKKIVEKENELFDKDSTCQINISLKELESEIKTESMKFLFSQENLIDSYSILNLYNFIKSYNTFDDSYFESKAVYVNDIEEFLDIKYELKEIFDKTVKDLCIYYLSILKSCDKINTDFDEMIVIPIIYQRLLYVLDFSTMAVLLNKVQDIDLNKTYIVNNANAFLDSLSLKQIMKKEIVSIIEE